jgi:hypothetical protein
VRPSPAPAPRPGGGRAGLICGPRRAALTASIAVGITKMDDHSLVVPCCRIRGARRTRRPAARRRAPRGRLQGRAACPGPRGRVPPSPGRPRTRRPWPVHAPLPAWQDWPIRALAVPPPPPPAPAPLPSILCADSKALTGRKRAVLRHATAAGAAAAEPLAARPSLANCSTRRAAAAAPSVARRRSPSAAARRAASASPSSNPASAALRRCGSVASAAGAGSTCGSAPKCRA